MPASARTDFLDVQHRELVADPKGTIRRVYDWLDLELTPTVERDDLRLAGSKPRWAPRAPTSYTAEQFGLSTAQIRSDYDFYIRHFDVAVEGLTR